ncbi:putative lipoprotein [Rickettsia hoogstraalii str. RCCE3]|nr:putative lipoprotein [Rickettsia hoogstraalii str. RCCE3]
MNLLEAISMLFAFVISCFNQTFSLNFKVPPLLIGASIKTASLKFVVVVASAKFKLSALMSVK